jgi:hypothetical protein
MRNQAPTQYVNPQNSGRGQAGSTATGNEVSSQGGNMVGRTSDNYAGSVWVRPGQPVSSSTIPHPDITSQILSAQDAIRKFDPLIKP